LFVVDDVDDVDDVLIITVDFHKIRIGYIPHSSQLLDICSSYLDDDSIEQVFSEIHFFVVQLSSFEQVSSRISKVRKPRRSRSKKGRMSTKKKHKSSSNENQKKKKRRTCFSSFSVPARTCCSISISFAMEDIFSCSWGMLRAWSSLSYSRKTKEKAEL